MASAKASFSFSSPLFLAENKADTRNKKSARKVRDLHFSFFSPFILFSAPSSTSLLSFSCPVRSLFPHTGNGSVHDSCLFAPHFKLAQGRFTKRRRRRRFWGRCDCGGASSAVDFPDVLWLQRQPRVWWTENKNIFFRLTCVDSP